MACLQEVRLQSRWGTRLLSCRSQRADRLALSGYPVDQTCRIQQRCCFIEELLDVESDFKPLFNERSAKDCAVGSVGGRPLFFDRRSGDFYRQGKTQADVPW